MKQPVQLGRVQESMLVPLYARAVESRRRRLMVKAALAQIAGNFPDASIAFDTVTRRAVVHANKDHERLRLDARFVWACPDPTEIERWQIGLRLVESLRLTDIPASLWSRLPWPMRVGFRALSRLLPGIADVYRFNLFAGRLGTGR